MIHAFINFHFIKYTHFHICRFVTEKWLPRLMEYKLVVINLCSFSAFRQQLVPHRLHEGFFTSASRSLSHIASGFYHYKAN